MDVNLLRARLLAFAAMGTFACTAQAVAVTPEASPAPLELQAQRLHALTSLADMASPENVPDRETLVTAMMIAMDVADPALVPRGDAGPAALPDLRVACANGYKATTQLVRLANATPEPGDTISRLSVALDRTTIMVTACTAREMDIQARELLKRGVGTGDAAVLGELQRLADDLIPRLTILTLGATLTDLNPNSRARTEADALPVLREAASAMTPEMRRKTLDAIDKALQKHEEAGTIDRAARARFLEPFHADACSASCKVLGR